MPVSEYFSQDYHSARELFQHAAQSAGAALQTFELPGHRDPSNRALTIDVGRIGTHEPFSPRSRVVNTRPTGLFYGGASATWSAKTLITILRQQLPPTVRYLAVLDLHTGLGPTAYGEPILTSRGAGDRERAKKWYGPEVEDLAADEAVAARLSGSISDGVSYARPDVELTFLALEFGTIPMVDVLTALRADHWLHSSPTVGPDLRTEIQLQIRNAFYCESPDWQAAVYGRTADFIYRACRGLAGSTG